VVLNDTPLHVVALIGVTAAFGLIVTVTVNVDPVPQLTVVGVTIYVAVCELLVPFAKLPVILAAPLPLVPPVIPPVTLGALQLYNVPAGTMPFVPFTGVSVNNAPSQLTPVIALILAVGLTVTVNVKLPFTPQLTVVGVIVYVAVCVVFVGLVNVPVIIDAPLPVPPPVILPVTDGALQLYVVPAGTTPFVPFVGVALNNTPLHVIDVIALIVAFGFTVTVNVKADPTQLPVVGVIV
jgi:hypothetical protein